MHSFYWSTLQSDQFDGTLSPVLVSDRNQTVLLGLLVDLAVHKATYFADYEGNEQAIQDFIDKCIEEIMVQRMSFPIGFIGNMANASLPDGWLYCNGDELLRADYPDLYNAITNTWGTATLGSSYFKLPDFRGKFLQGFAQGGGSPAMAASGGEATHTLTTAEMPAHTHTYGSTAGSGAVGTDTVAAGGVFTQPDLTTGSTGGGSAHNNLPPYLATNYIIFSGVYS